MSEWLLWWQRRFSKGGKALKFHESLVLQKSMLQVCVGVAEIVVNPVYLRLLDVEVKGHRQGFVHRTLLCRPFPGLPRP